MLLVEFLNFPRGEGPFCPARGGLQLVVHLIDRKSEQISASHNSPKRLTRKSKNAPFFSTPGM